MKIAQIRELTIGSIVANKLNHYKIVNINVEEGKIVSFDLEGIYAQLNTNALDRTVKLDSMRRYELIELAVEEIEIPNILVVLIMITSTIIIIINRNSHDYLLWLGLPTLISGILFLIFALSLNGTLNFVQIDNSIYITINKWFSSIIKNLINTSAFTIIIGLISTIMYIILKLKKQKDSVI